ncbi:hypothetical protein GCK72_023260 [Caenorhabditis remanei]|uniref:Uncharacterized protein n=1 Tax=Caenorhabditis remanei TaxID=31234 RepID=A0A6A5FWA9_CAERE|nr:hypothetical protein GCK72_023260 [Caenorhabditis remanei]KAF1746802.1 hypothetical protein GCK72_023260 [Caenorhabditis remanei]
MEIDSAGNDTDPVETIRVLREQLELLEKEHNFTGISLDHVTIPSLHTIMGVAQGFGFDNLLLWTTTMDCEDTGLKITKADIKQSRVRKSNLINLQKTVQMLDVELSSMLTVAVVLQHFQDSTLDGTDETEAAACPAEKCLYRDRSIGKAPLFDARLVKCETCEETYHAVCCGMWAAEEWELTNDPNNPLSCLGCRGITGVKVNALADEAIEFLKNEIELKKDELK